MVGYADLLLAQALGEYGGAAQSLVEAFGQSRELIVRSLRGAEPLTWACAGVALFLVWFAFGRAR